MMTSEEYKKVNPSGIHCNCIGCAKFRYAHGDHSNAKAHYPTQRDVKLILRVDRHFLETTEQGPTGTIYLLDRLTDFANGYKGSIDGDVLIPAHGEIDAKEIKGEEEKMAKHLEWKVIDEIIPNIDRIMLYGPPGTGKTSAGFRLAQLKGKNAYSVTLHADITAQECIGHFIPKGGDFVFHYGPFIKAWKEGAVLIINEINEASGPVLTALYAILDDSHIACLTLPNGETVRPEPGFQVIATMNGEPGELPEALKDRFDAKIKTAYPHPDALKKLEPKFRRFCENIYRSEDISASYRNLLALQLMLNSGVSRKVAMSVVFAERATEIDNALKIAETEKAG